MPEGMDIDARFKRALEKIDKQKSELARRHEDDVLVGIETIESDDGEDKLAQGATLTAINLFQHPLSHPVVLDLALLTKYGPEWLHWEPETLIWRISQDFHTTSVSDLNIAKVQATKTLHYNDSFWQRWEVFNWCCAPFNNVYPDFEVLHPPTVAQAMVAVDIAKRVRADVEWEEEVHEYLRVVCRYDGVFCPPEPLDFLDVGTEYGLVDCEEIRSRWDDVRKSDRPPAADSIVGEQLRRNLDAYHYLTESRERLRSQLPVIVR